MKKMHNIRTKSAFTAIYKPNMTLYLAFDNQLWMLLPYLWHRGMLPPSHKLVGPANCERGGSLGFSTTKLRQKNWFFHKAVWFFHKLMPQLVGPTGFSTKQFGFFHKLLDWFLHKAVWFFHKLVPQLAGPFLLVFPQTYDSVSKSH